VHSQYFAFNILLEKNLLANNAVFSDLNWSLFLRIRRSTRCPSRSTSWWTRLGWALWKPFQDPGLTNYVQVIYLFTSYLLKLRIWTIHS